jgi:hypothetical protein
MKRGEAPPPHMNRTSCTVALLYRVYRAYRSRSDTPISKPTHPRNATRLPGHDRMQPTAPSLQTWACTAPAPENFMGIAQILPPDPPLQALTWGLTWAILLAGQVRGAGTHPPRKARDLPEPTQTVPAGAIMGASPSPARRGDRGGGTSAMSVRPGGGPPVESRVNRLVSANRFVTCQ